MNELDTTELIEKSNKRVNIILDASTLTTLMACPCKMDLVNNHNFVSLKGKSNGLETGSIFHKFAEVYYGTIIKGLSRKEAFGFGMAAAEMYIQSCPFCTDFVPYDCNDCKGEGQYRVSDGSEEGHIEECKGCHQGKIIKPSCGHRKNDYPGVQNTPAESEGYKTGWKWVLTTCEQYAEFYKNDHWIPLEVEVVKSEVLYEDDEIRILWKAKLDLTADTNQGIFPIDHKTMKQNRDQLNLNNQFTGQCIIMKTRSTIINKVGFQKTLKPEEKFKRELVSYTPQRLIEWQSEILPYYAKMMLMYHETGQWPRNYTQCEGKYGLCQFTGVCGANPDMREEELRLNFKVGDAWNPTNEDE